VQAAQREIDETTAALEQALAEELASELGEAESKSDPRE
jgi:DNA-directed RNA polymerase subunit omega